jgi:hypothetical protein
MLGREVKIAVAEVDAGLDIGAFDPFVKRVQYDEVWMGS